MSAALHGHAVEVRLYAEDPRTFLPQAGRIERLRLPGSVRVDAGVEEGDEVGTALRPDDREADRARRDARRGARPAAAALAETEVGGVTTNLPFLRWLVAHPALRAGETTTAFLAEYPPLSRPAGAAAPTRWRGGFRLNLPAAAARRLPTSTPPAHEHGPGEAVEQRRRADAGHGDQGARRRRRRGRGAPAARRARGDEDGDAARRAVRRDGGARSTWPKAIASPAGRCSSSWCGRGSGSDAA